MRGKKMAEMVLGSRRSCSRLPPVSAWTGRGLAPLFGLPCLQHRRPPGEPQHVLLQLGGSLLHLADANAFHGSAG